MKKVLLAVIALLAMSQVLLADDYDISGLWYIEGDGFAKEKLLDVVKVRVPVSGIMNVYVSDLSEFSGDIAGHLQYYNRELSGDVKFITGYDIYIRIDLTRFGFKVWDKHIENGIKDPIPLPEARPSTNRPYKLATVRVNDEEQDMSYSVTLTSSYSGTIAINGIIKDVDIAREIEIASDSAVWKNGTGRPVTDSGVHGGCNSGTGIFAAILLLGVYVIVRH